MKDILSPANREVLQRSAASNVLLAFDYDGTLAPIVSDPERASMRKATRDLLTSLTKLYRVIVISGRAQADALKRLRGVGVFEVVGNHGMEPWSYSDGAIAGVQRWRPAIERAVAAFEGVEIEDKVFSLAVHYRRCQQKRAAHAAILRAAEAISGARVVGGKQVVNVLPEGAPHKGIALERARARLGCDGAIYVGDDEPDEDVFRLDWPGTLVTIRVGRKRASAARYYVASQDAVDDLLRELLSLRERSADEAGDAR